MKYDLLFRQINIEKHKIAIRDKNSVKFVLSFNNLYTNTTSKYFHRLAKYTMQMWLTISVVDVFINLILYLPKHM